MKDFEILKEMFDRNGIEYTEDVDIDERALSFTVEAGYSGFFSIFSFNKDGSLKSVEAYE